MNPELILALPQVSQHPRSAFGREVQAIAQKFWPVTLLLARCMEPPGARVEVPYLAGFPARNGGSTHNELLTQGTLE